MNISAKIPLVTVPENYPNIEDLYVQYVVIEDVQQLLVRVDSAVQDYATGQTPVMDLAAKLHEHMSDDDRNLLYDMIVRHP